jgi:hypothetical protein
MDALLTQLSQPTKDVIAAVLLGTLDLSREERRLLANLLNNTNPCKHHNTTLSCNTCQQPGTTNCRHNTIRVTCPDCLWSTVSQD